MPAGILITWIIPPALIQNWRIDPGEDRRKSAQTIIKFSQRIRTSERYTSSPPPPMLSVGGIPRTRKNLFVLP